MPSPPATGLIYWFNGAGPNFGDYAGAVPAVSPLGRVARVDQPSPATAGSWLTPDQTTSRGWQDTNGVDLQYGAQCYFNQPSGLTLPHANKCVWGFAFQFRGAPTSAAVWSVFVGNDSVGEVGLIVDFGDLFWTSQGSLFDTALVPRPGSMIYGFVAPGVSATPWTIVIDGVTHTGSFSTTPPSGTISAMQVGKYRTNYTQCGIAHVLGYDNTSGTVDTTALLAYLATQAEGFPL
jgi:hypothetical protein